MHKRISSLAEQFRHGSLRVRIFLGGLVVALYGAYVVLMGELLAYLGVS